MPFGRPLVLDAVRPVPAGVTVENVIDNYFSAVGGKDNFKNMKDLTMKMKTSMMGMDFTVTSFQKAPDKLRMETAMGGNVMSTQLFDGEQSSCGFSHGPPGVYSRA
jgi:zinc protease